VVEAILGEAHAREPFLVKRERAVGHDLPALAVPRSTAEDAHNAALAVDEGNGEPEGYQHVMQVEDEATCSPSHPQ
jgi:hypothetical protein